MIICTKGHVFDKDLLPREPKEGLYANTATHCLIKDCYGKMIECDDMLVPAIVEFNKNGYATAFSCSGHYGSPIASFYVAFERMTPFEIFNMVADIIYLSKTTHIEVDYFDLKILKADAMYSFRDLVYKVHMSDVYEYEGQDIATKILKPLKMAMIDNGADAFFQMVRPSFSISIEINLDYIGYDKLKQTFDVCRDEDCMKLIYDCNMQVYKLASALNNVGALENEAFKEEFFDDELRNWYSVLINERNVPQSKTVCAVAANDSFDDDDLEDDDLIESLVMKPVDDFDRDCDDDDDDYDELDPESPLLSKIDNAIKKLSEEDEEDESLLLTKVENFDKLFEEDTSVSKSHAAAKKVPVKKKKTD